MNFSSSHFSVVFLGSVFNQILIRIRIRNTADKNVKDHFQKSKFDV